MPNADFKKISNLMFDGYGSGSAIPSAELLSAAVSEPASLIR
jgi:NifU-like protein involved in Fe-S cluster formation